MTDPVESTACLVHPHQLEVKDFASYSLVIDARSPHEYAEDHIPGAVNLPVVDDGEFAEVGIRHKTDNHAAYLVGVDYSLRNIADQIKPLISRYTPADTSATTACCVRAPMPRSSCCWQPSTSWSASPTWEPRPLRDDHGRGSDQDGTTGGSPDAASCAGTDAHVPLCRACEACGAWMAADATACRGQRRGADLGLRIKRFSLSIGLRRSAV
jgi:hypothetical protein